MMMMLIDGVDVGIKYKSTANMSIIWYPPLIVDYI